jgi:protein-S-isoprenylcysteine O-methyltransferase Ste14
MFVFRTIFVGSALQFIALVAGPYIAVQFDYLAPPIPLGWLRILGVPLMLVGIPLTAWCAYILLGPGRGKAVPYDSPDGLSISGPYTRIRNPFMLGWLLILWGEVIFICSIPLLVYAIVLSLCIHFWVLAFEEPSLEDRYGDEYRQYKTNVPRWIPKLHKNT